MICDKYLTKRELDANPKKLPAHRIREIQDLVEGYRVRDHHQSEEDAYQAVRRALVVYRNGRSITSAVSDVGRVNCTIERAFRTLKGEYTATKKVSEDAAQAVKDLAHTFNRNMGQILRQMDEITSYYVELKEVSQLPPLIPPPPPSHKRKNRELEELEEGEKQAWKPRRSERKKRAKRNW